MGKVTGFKEYQRELPPDRPIEERLRDSAEIHTRMLPDLLRRQAARCMDCGTPFCHSGCPLGNIIPDWNDLVYRGLWREALDELLATNNFPEFTGRLCPAPCEEACVLSINFPAVTIELIEREIIEHAFDSGWIVPARPAPSTGRKVAVVGSGPAGLACAQQLNRAGHNVSVFERADKIGGLLRYGIPDFKLEKHIIDRRIRLMEAEGVEFHTGVNVGADDMPVEKLKSYDAVVLCGGARRPRDLPVPGRNLAGIHFALDFLEQQNRRVAGLDPTGTGMEPIDAAGKHVVVIGGGDTGSDCIGTANRQGARSVVNFEIMPIPPLDRPHHQPWPYYPSRRRTSTSHEEGCERYWSIMAKEFIGADGHVKQVRTVNVQFVPDSDSGRLIPHEIPETSYLWQADLVLLAMGFLGPETALIDALGLQCDPRGNVLTDENYMTSVPGIFAAGDMRRGQSLIVWAISEGREAARAVDIYLMGSSELPTKGNYDLPRV